MSKIYIYTFLLLMATLTRAQQDASVLTDENDVALVSSDDDSFKGKLRINEVFFVHDMEGVLYRDFWIELINVSENSIVLENISLSTDTVYGKHNIENTESDEGLPYLIKDEVLLVNMTSKYGLRTPYAVEVGDRGDVIYLFHNNEVIDSVVVPILDRDQSFARLPNGVGDFITVRLMTPNKSNAQLLPSRYTKSKSQLIHLVGLSSSNYFIEDQEIGSKARIGANIGFAWQKRLGLADLRYGVAFKSLGFGIENDSTLNTAFAEVKITNSGFQRMEYFVPSFELGIPITDRLQLFYGIAFNIRLNITTRVFSNITTTLNDGTEVSNETTEVNSAFIPEQIDLMNTIAFEYRVIDNVLFNVSFSKDFSGLLLGDSRINENKIKTNLFEFKLVVPFLQSKRLVKKGMLFDLNKNN